MGHYQKKSSSRAPKKTSLLFKHFHFMDKIVSINYFYFPLYIGEAPVLKIQNLFNGTSKGS